MTVKDQLNHEAKAAEQTAEFLEDVIEAAVRFCRAHCFHGRKDGIGESNECSICPLARWTLGANTRRK